MKPDREVPIGALLARGIQEQEAHHICGNKPTVPWHKLARIDGGLAISVLTEEEFGLILAELRRGGLPAVAEFTRQNLLELVITIAANECPEHGTPWYNTELHSAVACAQLLKLVQQSWGFDADEVKRREQSNFAKLLGVAANVVPV